MSLGYCHYHGGPRSCVRCLPVARAGRFERLTGEARAPGSAISRRSPATRPHRRQVVAPRRPTSSPPSAPATVPRCARLHRHPAGARHAHDRSGLFRACCVGAGARRSRDLRAGAAPADRLFRRRDRPATTASAVPRPIGTVCFCRDRRLHAAAGRSIASDADRRSAPALCLPPCRSAARLERRAGSASHSTPGSGCLEPPPAR